jgi:hypothetical protein
MSLDDNLALERMGLLRPRQGALLADPRISKLTEGERELLVQLTLADKHELCRSALKRQPIRDAAETLELMGHVTWERDNRGRPVYLTLTWKGEEIGEALLHTFAGTGQRDG